MFCNDASNDDSNERKGNKKDQTTHTNEIGIINWFVDCRRDNFGIMNRRFVHVRINNNGIDNLTIDNTGIFNNSVANELILNNSPIVPTGSLGFAFICIVAALRQRDRVNGNKQKQQCDEFHHY